MKFFAADDTYWCKGERAAHLDRPESLSTHTLELVRRDKRQLVRSATKSTVGRTSEEMDERGTPADAETNPWESSGDRQGIVELFETLRGKLTFFFEARRCVDPEGLADTTLERVIQKLCEGTRVSDLTGYSFGVAKNIIREDARKERARQRYVEEQRHRLQAVRGEEDDEAALRERRLKCLEDCTARLSERERWTLFEYYKVRGQSKLEHRKKMAEQLDISRDALTLRIFHLKQRLKRCINGCLENDPAE